MRSSTYVRTYGTYVRTVRTYVRRIGAVLITSYFLPTFDGDSIFNVFSFEPTTDARRADRHAGPFQLDASAWLRRYSHLDGASSVAGGLSAGVERVLTSRWRGRADALWDDGYGGRRAGGGATAFW